MPLKCFGRAEDGNKKLHNGTMQPGERGNFVLCPGYTDGLDISLRASQNFNPQGSQHNTPIAASCRAPNRYKDLGIFVGATNGLVYIVDLLTMERKVHGRFLGPVVNPLVWHRLHS